MLDVDVMTQFDRAVPLTAERAVVGLLLSRDLRPQQPSAGHNIAARVAHLKAALIDQSLPFGTHKRRGNYVRASQRASGIGKVIYVDDGVAIVLIEPVAAHIAPIRQQGRRLDNVRPLCARKSRQVVVRAARKSKRIWVATFNGLDVSDLPPAENRIGNATRVHPVLALAERQLVSHIGDEAVVAVITCPGFLQAPVLNGRNARPVVIVILAVDGLRIRIECAEAQPIRHALIQLQGSAMIGGVAEVRAQVDVAVIGERTEILRGR